MIQIDMPMPKSCVECRFSQGGYMYCHAMPENFCGYVNYCEEDGKPEWCPLKAQEPRVMTLDEVLAAEVVYVEDIDKAEIIPVLVDRRAHDRIVLVRARLMGSPSLTIYPLISEYGKR